MEVRELKVLLALMCDYGLVELEIEDKKGKVRLVRGHSGQAENRGVTLPAKIGAHIVPPIVSAPHPQNPAAPAVPGKAGASGDGIELAPNQKLVTSPMVGTFYRAAAPNAHPFVEEGDTVRKGQPLCIIEAMKMMNEIEAEASGRVVRILCGNGQPVEYGQPMMILGAA